MKFQWPNIDKLPKFVGKKLCTFYGGCIYEAKKQRKFIVGFKSHKCQKSFFIRDYQSEEACKIAAESYRLDYASKHNDLIRHVYESALSEEQKQYVAGFLDGDGCILFSGKKLRISFTQAGETKCPDVFQWIHENYGGRLQNNGRRGENQRLPWQLNFNGVHALPLLEDLSKHCIIKRNQAIWALQFLKQELNLPIDGKKVQTATLIQQVKQAKSKYDEVHVDINNTSLTSAYVSGFFDAEGCIRTYRKGTSYVQVALGQKYCTSIIEAINCKFGTQSTLSGLTRPSKDECVMCLNGAHAEMFMRNILPYSIVKQSQIEDALKLRKYSFIHFRKRTRTDGENMENLKQQIKRAKYC
jgi:intein-encoded DNA endonuclease-like protein